MKLEKLEQIRDKKVLVYGDYMVDRYIDGSVNRISPEAPVPVLEVCNMTQKLGGSGNVIHNLCTLGVKVTPLGSLGQDEAGDYLISSFQKMGCNTELLKQYSEVKTILKTRVVCNNQQFIRLDEEEKKEPPVEYKEWLEGHVEDIFDGVDGVVISDYGKGAVSKEIAQWLIQNARQRTVPIIVDPKGTDYSKYQNATICTPNTKELEAVMGQPVKTEEQVEELGKSLQEKIGLEYLLVTRSEKGLSLFERAKAHKKDFPALKKEVIDVTGAGDTVVATVIAMLVLGFSMDDICVIANAAASVVVSKFGTSTVSVQELYDAMQDAKDFKEITVVTAKSICNELKEHGKKIVFTNGCFDILHIGHIRYLQKAKEQGDILFVGLNSDDSIKRLKGINRPIIPEKERLEMLNSLSCVDYVVLFDEDTPYHLIEAIHPDVLVKGADYQKDFEEKKIVGQTLVESYGGKVFLAPFEKGKSTTNIIERILTIAGEKHSEK